MNKEQIQEIVAKYDFEYPFDSKYQVTSTYQEHLRDKANGRHLFAGTDYAVYYGHIIKAPYDGKLSVRTDGGLGKRAIFRYTINGILFVWHFGHCSALGKSGSKSKGQMVGKSGNTGFTIPRPTKANPYAGTHVHVTLKIDGQIVDPKPWLDAMWLQRQGKLEVKPTYDELQDTVDQLQSRVEALTRQVEAYETIPEVEHQIGLSEADILLINETSMDTAKTTAQSLKDGGKYIAFAQPIGAMIAFFIARSLELTADELILVTTGITAITTGAINLGAIVIKKKFLS